MTTNTNAIETVLFGTTINVTTAPTNARFKGTHRAEWDNRAYFNSARKDNRVKKEVVFNGYADFNTTDYKTERDFTDAVLTGNLTLTAEQQALSNKAMVILSDKLAKRMAIRTFRRIVENQNGRSLYRDEAAVDDMTQDVCVAGGILAAFYGHEFVENIDNFENDSPSIAISRKMRGAICRNARRMWYKSRGGRGPNGLTSRQYKSRPDMEHAGTVVDGELSMDSINDGRIDLMFNTSETIDALFRVFKFSATEKNMLVLRFVHGYTVKEVSETLGINAATRMFRLIEKINAEVGHFNRVSRLADSVSPEYRSLLPAIKGYSKPDYRFDIIDIDPF